MFSTPKIAKYFDDDVVTKVTVSFTDYTGEVVQGNVYVYLNGNNEDLNGKSDDDLIALAKEKILADLNKEEG